MTYHRGSLEDFNIWHEAAKLADGITEDGKVGFVNGIPAPNNQRTTEYSAAIPHPVNQDDYLWNFGAYPDGGKTNLSYEDAVAAGWFGEGV